MLSQEAAARLLGMKTREVVEVVSVGAHYVATLHDGTKVSVGETGVAEALPPVPLEVGEQTGGLITPDPDTGPVLPSEGGEPGTFGQNFVDELVADVPDGTVDEVLTWVNGDAERALLAFTVEQEREKPRSTLLAKLEELVSA